jgi:tetratricopeptide (TPR) repeat protein
VDSLRPAGRKDSTAIAAAAGALGVGEPAAALAALLRAHELAPRDPVPLINAAALLSQAGKGRAALGLLDAAKRLKAPKTNPFGITWSALMMANRGQALIVTRRYAQATKTLAAAVKAAPLLREAKQNMGVAYACQGDDEQATRYLVAAVRRQTFRGDYIISDPPEPPEYQKLNPVEVLDSSKGQTLTLKTLSYPKTWQEGMTQGPKWQALMNDVVGQVSAQTQELVSDRTLLNGYLQKANPLTRQRTQEIIDAALSAAGAPDIRLLDQEGVKYLDQITSLQLRGYGDAGCLNDNLHGEWLLALENYDRAERTYAAAVYGRTTALGANLANPLAHAVVMDEARLYALTNLAKMVGGGALLSGYDRICHLEGGVPSQEPASGQDQTPESQPCPKGITGPDFELELLVFSFLVHCEEITVRASTPSWLGPFIAVTRNFGNGSTTIFAGAQVGKKLTWGPLAGGATARGGVYVTFGADGSVQDTGLRSTTSVGASVGLSEGPGLGAGVKIPISGPGASISFAGVFPPLI